jgi:hypothetical protein
VSVASWNGGASSNGGGLSFDYSTPVFIVGKIEWGATAGDDETITLYTPSTTDLGTLGTGVSKTAAGFDQTALDTVSFSQRNSGGTYSFDEIRFGATYESVIGQGSSGPGPLDHFAISPIASPQSVGTPITGITITAQDASDATVTDFTGTVTFGGTGGFSGTSANFVAGVLTGASATPTVAGSDLTFTVDDGAGHTGSATIATIQSVYEAWSGGLPFGGDGNGDGVEDGMAWLLGAAGPAIDARGLLPAADEETGALVLSFSCLNEASRGGAVLSVQHSSDLGLADPWSSTDVPESSGTVGGVSFSVTPNGDLNDVIATIPADHGEAGRIFGRLRGQELP